MAYRPQVLTVPNGGTGVVTNTAYAVLCGGTTATDDIQSIASVGTSGQVLTSNGPGALPTFQNSSSANTFMTPISFGLSTDNPADSTTYYVDDGGGLTTGATAHWIIFPVACTITAFSMRISYTNSPSNEATSFYVRVNNSTDNVITTTFDFSASASPQIVTVTGLSISISQGDFISIKVVTPAYTTNPTGVNIRSSIYSSVP